MIHGAIWVVGELADDRLARVSGQVATLARDLAARAGLEVVGVIVGANPLPAATDLAAYVPRVLAVEQDAMVDHGAAALVADSLLALIERDQPALLLMGATQDGRDLAGLLSGCLEWGILTNANSVVWDGTPIVEKVVFGGGLRTTSRFLEDRGIITVVPNAVSATATATRGLVEIVEAVGRPRLPIVPLLECTAAVAGASELEEARVIVAGGRGVGGPEGFRVIEQLAEALGGSVGASLAAAEAGWIDHTRVIGQTGKMVKPSLYVAVGISGALQHRAGIQGAETVVAVNVDPDAPIAAFADLIVVGDFLELVPAIAAELRAHPA